jgi:hypothetical protein
MSFLFGNKPKLSSDEKLDAAMTEVEMVSDMFNRYVGSRGMRTFSFAFLRTLILPLGSLAFS